MIHRDNEIVIGTRGAIGITVVILAPFFALWFWGVNAILSKIDAQSARLNNPAPYVERHCK